MKLDILKNSLEKKEALLRKAFEDDYNYVIKAQGEPLAGTKTYHTWQKKIANYDKKIKNLEDSIQKTKKAIEKEELKLKGLNSMGHIIGSVDNIQKLLDKSKECYSKSNKRYYEKKAQELIDMQDKVKLADTLINDKTKQLIAEGKVKQWDKKPLFYFVKGFKKAGLMICYTGDLYFTKHYRISDEDKAKISVYLGLDFPDILKRHKEIVAKKQEELNNVS